MYVRYNLEVSNILYTLRTYEYIIIYLKFHMSSSSDVLSP
jgi:hypothetical protein